MRVFSCLAQKSNKIVGITQSNRLIHVLFTADFKASKVHKLGLKARYEACLLLKSAVSCQIQRSLLA